MTIEISKFELKILEQMQNDCTLSTSELAERVGLSQSPCWRRLQRLKDKGFIKKQVAILDRAKLGPSMYIFAYLKMATLTEREREDFVRKIALVPEVMECHMIFGEMDILIKVLAQSMDWYQDFVFKTIFKLPGVQDIQSIITLGELKSTTAIPLGRVPVSSSA